MTTQTRTQAGDFPFNRLIAIAVWLLGCLATYAGIAVLLGADAPWYISAGVALVAQAMFTAVEYRAFRRGMDEVAVIVIGLDVAANVGGLYGPMTRVGQTGFGQAIADVFGVSDSVGKVSAFILAAVVGYALARAPEKIWESG